MSSELETLKIKYDQLAKECERLKSEISRLEESGVGMKQRAISLAERDAEIARLRSALERIAAPITGNVGDKIVCLNTIDAWHAIAREALKK